MDARESENPRPPSNVGESNEGTHRHGRSRSGWGLSTAVHAVHGVGFVAKKVINNRYTDSLWHTRKSSSSASGPSDASSDAKRENHSHETASHHSTHPSLNVEDEQPTHEREDVPLHGRNVNTMGSNVGDQLEDLKPQEVDERSENKKPTDGSHVKSVNQHRWPSSSTAGSTVWPSTAAGNSKPSASSHGRQVNQHRWPGTTSSNVVNQSENLEPSDGSHAKPVNQHRWPGTAGSNVLNKTINNFYEASRVPKLNRKSFPYSKSSQESSTNATNPPSSSVVDDDKVIESQPSSPNKSHVLASKGVSPLRTRAFTKGVKPSRIVRGASLTPATRGDSDTTTTRGSSPVSTRGVSPTPARGVSPTPSREVILTPARGVSPTPSRGVSPTPSRGVSPTPSRGVSPTPSTGVSPMPTREVDHHARDISPTPVKPHKSSGRRHFFSANILSVFTKIVDNRKEKHVSDLKEAAQHLELLYNIQVQWQFANASAEAALDHQRKTAEKSLSDVWRAILELRDSLASKKVDMTLLILQLKLYAVLYRQMAYIDEWASIQKEHESALFATTNDLQARSLSLPITGGVKADIKSLKLIVFSTIQVLQATISCIQSTLSKLDKTHFLASELANLVLHERALLDECEIFLASAAPLHVRPFITMT
ncbi:putative QWRF family protein [Helianthus annuus]|nr:putative QWRF family protein [Helianthus annuus]KAJ0766907.1 putative QWRF family protein [Helianthus annuus]